MKAIFAVMNTTWAVVKIRPEKKFRPVRDLNPWPLRYRCSALPTELRSQLEVCYHVVLNKPVMWLINDCEYMKVIYLNCRWRIKKINVFFRPYFHFCSSSAHYREDRFHIHVFVCRLYQKTMGSPPPSWGKLTSGIYRHLCKNGQRLLPFWIMLRSLAV